MALTETRELFETLVKGSARSLAIFVNSLVADPGSADDIVQETLIVAWKNIERYDAERAFGHWLRGIARKLILAHHRTTAHRALLVAGVIDRIDDLCQATEDEENDMLLGLLECIDGLPSIYKTAVTRRYQHDIRGQKLAAELNTSWSNVKKRLSRGKHLLLECMRRKWPRFLMDRPPAGGER